MKYLEYMEAHENENFDWCKPYANDTETSFIIVYDGEALAITTPTMEVYRYDGSLNDDILRKFAKRVNQSYDVYHGWSDLQIALEAMHEVGCASCPLKYGCDVMMEDIEDY